MNPRAVRRSAMRSAVETPCHAGYDRSMATSIDPSPEHPSESRADGRSLVENQAPDGRFRLANLRRSDRILGGCAAVLLVSGLLLQGYGAMRGAAPAGTESSRLIAENGRSGAGALTLQPGGALVDDRGARRQPAGSPPASTRVSAESPGSDDLVEKWSPAMIRGGFGFFVGFAVGLVLRIFFRVSIVVIGLNLLLLFGLSYMGWLEVHWETIEAQFDQWMLSLEQQFTQFKTFISGSLPTVGLSGAGLFTGFRKR